MIILAAFKSILSQSRYSLEPKKTAEGLRAPPDPPALLTLAMLTFLLIMFTSGIISIFYLILFPAGFSGRHLGHNKTA